MQLEAQQKHLLHMESQEAAVASLLVGSRWFERGSTIYKWLQLILFCQVLEQIEHEWNIIVFSPDILFPPLLEFVFLLLYEIHKPAATVHRQSDAPICFRQVILKFCRHASC